MIPADMGGYFHLEAYLLGGVPSRSVIAAYCLELRQPAYGWRPGVNHAIYNFMGIKVFQGR